MNIDLNMIIGAIGSVATIETRIREAINQYKKNNNKKKIEKIDLEIKLTKLKKLDEYSEEVIDKFITEHVSSFKSINLNRVFSDPEKNNFITSFFEKNQDMIFYRDIISNILNEYIDEIEEYISKFMTDGEKVIVKKVNHISNQVDNVCDEIADNSKIIKSMNRNIENMAGKICDLNIFRDSNYSSSIIGLLNMIFLEIEKNTGEKLLKKVLTTDSLKAENFEDVIFRIQKAISQIDRERIEDITKNNFDNGLYALHFYIQYIAADFANKVNLIFSENTQLLIDIIYCYEDKNPQYYLALGAMGLRNSHTDENIYSYVMDGLISYLSRLLEVLKEKWKNRDYDSLDVIAVEEMQKRLWYQIQFAINEKNKQWIIEIVKNDNITDVELATRFNVSVKDLRKELYVATKTFLHHRYFDNYTTSLIINDDYKEVLMKKLSIEVEE